MSSSAANRAGSLVILAGGGLANCLIAWRLAQARPELGLTVLEAGPTLGGNHTWSFHTCDVPAARFAWLEPLIAHSWSHYDVKFPARERRIEGGYHSITAEHLHRTVLAALGDRVLLDAEVVELTPRTVVLRDGRVLTGDVVIDGRGASSFPGFDLRYQKFLGQVLALRAPHGLTGPLLMDATVPQRDGYRFIYLLPFAADQLLVEDTYYSDTPELDGVALRRNIGAYAASRGWEIARVLREETGVLPIVLDGEAETFWPAADGAQPRSGLRAGLFHHTTGYSLPEAASLADDLAELAGLAAGDGGGRAGALRSDAIAIWVRALFLARWQAQWFFRLLNRMLFRAAEPAERYRVLQHFYRLPADLIGRFYAGQLRGTDGLRILSGTPPVSVVRALRSALPRSAPGPRGRASP